MKRPNIIGILIGITHFSAAHASTGLECFQSYEKASTRLNGMLNTAKLITINGGLTTTAVQTSLAVAGLTTVGGLVTGGSALVGAGATIALLSQRKRSLDKVLKLYLKAKAGDLASTELTQSVLRHMETGDACVVKNNGDFRPTGFHRFIKNVRKGLHP